MFLFETPQGFPSVYIATRNSDYNGAAVKLRTPRYLSNPHSAINNCGLLASALATAEDRKSGSRRWSTEINAKAWVWDGINWLLEGGDSRGQGLPITGQAMMGKVKHIASLLPSTSNPLYLRAFDEKTLCRLLQRHARRRV